MYAVARELGGGSYGKVFQASELGTRRQFAIKKLYLRPDARAECIISLRELDMMASFQHPHLMPLTDAILRIPPTVPEITDDGREDNISLVMPCGDCTLHDKIRQKAPLAERKAYLWQMLSGLHYLHQHNIIHRDLKPENFLLFGTQLKISDFGMSRYYIACEKRSPGLVTAWYRAPEIFYQQPYGLASDIWSLGCIWAETISGQPLVDGHSTKDRQTDHYNREVDYNTHQKIYKMFGGQPPIWTGNGPLPVTTGLATNVSRITSRRTGGLRPITYSAASITIHEALRLNPQIISEFDRSPGTYQQFLDLLAQMLIIDPATRATTTTLLKHEFFDGYRPQLAATVQGPVTPHQVHFDERRDLAVLLLDHQNYDKYSYRVKFLALDIIDRILLARPLADETGIRKYTMVALYLAEKYWRGEEACSIYDLVAIEEMDFDGYPQREHEVIRDILHYRIYRPTLYDYLTELKDIKRAYHIFRHALPFNGLRLDYWATMVIWLLRHYYDEKIKPVAHLPLMQPNSA